MSYVSADLNLLVPSVGGSMALWGYTTTDTVSGTVDVDGYFSDGAAKGMKAGDSMIIHGATGGSITCETHYCESATSVLAA